MADFSITRAIDFGDFPNDMMELIGRFVWLPEFGMHEELRRVEQQCIKAADADVVAASERRKARQMAHTILRNVRKEWSEGQIVQATGYKP